MHQLHRSRWLRLRSRYVIYPTPLISVSIDSVIICLCVCLWTVTLTAFSFLLPNYSQPSCRTHPRLPMVDRLPTRFLHPHLQARKPRSICQHDHHMSCRRCKSHRRSVPFSRDLLCQVSLHVTDCRVMQCIQIQFGTIWPESSLERVSEDPLSRTTIIRGFTRLKTSTTVALHLAMIFQTMVMLSRSRLASWSTWPSKC